MNQVVNLLPKAWQPYAKALAPVVMTLVGVASQYAATGQLDSDSLAIGVGGLVTTVLVFVLPNKPKA